MNEKIKDFAEQAGMEWETQSWCWLANPPHLEKFAELVRQDEREANAKLLEALKEIASETYDEWTNGAKAQRIAKAAIAKATGEQS